MVGLPLARVIFFSRHGVPWPTEEVRNVHQPSFRLVAHALRLHPAIGVPVRAPEVKDIPTLASDHESLPFRSGVHWMDDGEVGGSVAGGVSVGMIGTIIVEVQIASGPRGCALRQGLERDTASRRRFSRRLL